MHVLKGTVATTASAVLQTLFQMVSAPHAPMGKLRTPARQRARTARKALQAPVARVSNALRAQKPIRRHNQHLVRTALKLRLVLMAHAPRAKLGNMRPTIARPAICVAPASTGPGMIQQARAFSVHRARTLMVAQPSAKPVTSERPETQARAMHVLLAKKELQTMRQVAQSAGMA